MPQGAHLSDALLGPVMQAHASPGLGCGSAPIERVALDAVGCFAAVVVVGHEVVGAWEWQCFQAVNVDRQVGVRACTCGGHWGRRLRDG